MTVKLPTRLLSYSLVTVTCTMIKKITFFIFPNDISKSSASKIGMYDFG